MKYTKFLSILSLCLGLSLSLSAQKTKKAQKQKGEVIEKPIICDFKKASPDSILYIIDGKEVSQEASKVLSPNEIANITVLKDAEATALYGSRASKGVVLITTKQGAQQSQHNLQICPAKPEQSKQQCQKPQTKGQIAGIKVHKEQKGKIQNIKHQENANTCAPKEAMLYIVDGKACTYEELKAISPTNIAEMKVVKDPQVLSAYGEAGKHGVIILTTKSKKP